MRIKFTGKNINLSDALKSYTEKRLSKLDKFLGDNCEAQVVMSLEKGRHRIEVTIPLNGVILRGEEVDYDMYTSIDQVVDKLERQVKKYRTRLQKKTRRESLKDVPVAGEATEKEEIGQLVRTKKVELLPMSVEEAIMQMDLLGHSFFMFLNAESGNINVVYKRRDGNYGLIEPQGI